MSKRTKTSSALNNPQNFWVTPVGPIHKLARHLPFGLIFDEPCAGDGAILRGLAPFGIICGAAHDMTPRAEGIVPGDATRLPLSGRPIITNPPYGWPLLKPLLDHWVGRAECWLLLPWDMPCNVRMSPYAAHIDRILPLGRVKWIVGSKSTGMENSGWFHFDIARQGLILPR